QQFPLHFFAGFQTDRRRQGQRKIDIKPRLLILGADGLNFKWIFYLHLIGKLAYRLATCQPFLPSFPPISSPCSLIAWVRVRWSPTSPQVISAAMAACSCCVNSMRVWVSLGPWP